MALGQGSGYSRDRSGRGSGAGYQSGRYQGGSALRGPHGDVSTRMVSLKGVRA